jgi:hypothetical protein
LRAKIAAGGLAAWAEGYLASRRAATDSAA